MHSRSIILRTFMFCISIFCIQLEGMKKGCEKEICRLSKQIMSTRCSKPQQTKQNLIDIIKQLRITQQLISYKTLHHALTALTYESKVELPEDSETILYKSLTYFHKTPGFIVPFYRFLETVQEYRVAKGFFYEIKSAVDLVENEQKEIVAFNSTLSYGNIKREFDLVVKKKNSSKLELIECKNITWDKVQPKSPYGKKLTKQFQNQQEIAVKTKQPRQEYSVRSCTPISSQFERWFEKKGIKYHAPPSPPSSPSLGIDSHSASSSISAVSST